MREFGIIVTTHFNGDAMLNKEYFENLQSYIEILQQSQEPIFIYGMGDGCLKVLKIFADYGIKCSGIFASDEFVRDKIFEGFKIMRLSEVEAQNPQFTAVLAFGAGYPELIEKIDNLSRRHRLIVPDMPVIGDGLFTKEYLFENFAKTEKVYNLLADGASRACFKAVLEFKITGDIEALKRCETEAAEAFENILKPSETEVYADLGAYTGDTVAEFLKHTNGRYGKIYAIEPNPRNFRKLTENTQNLQNIALIHAFASEKCGKTTVLKGGGRMIRRSDVGVEIDVVTLDSVLQGERCNYIKYDVEGEELQALNGSKQTIAAFKPKLNVALYHRVGDIFELPLKVLELNPNYKIYMRHLPYYPAWDTNLYAV